MMAQINLRPVAEEDLPNYVLWLNDPEVTQFLQGVEAGNVTLESEREWLKAITADELDHTWAIEIDGRHIGSSRLHLDAGQATASFGLVIGDKAAWNKGYGQAVLQEVLRRGFEELDLHRIYLTVFARNYRAQRCYEKCGFRLEGTMRQSVLKRGRWEDIIRMAILREEWEALQAPPTEAGEIQLREFRLSDYEQLRALWQASGLPPRPSDREEEVAKKLARDPDLFLVAWEGARIIGSVIGGWDGRRGYIYRLAVLPDCQRRGVGRRLIKELEKRFRSKGTLAVNLNYDAGNPRARAFYRSLGYEERKGAGVMGKSLEIPGEEKDEK
jgi:RimJ/RimL family protein N-acetyltransferase